MKKKPIPDITDILKMYDKEDKDRYAISHPSAAKEKAMNYIEENSDKINESVYKDFTTITLGDYISAAHTFNREMMSASMDAHSKAAYFTLFAFEERARRIKEHYSYVQ